MVPSVGTSYTVMSSSELTTRPEICGTMRVGICWYGCR